MIMGKDNMNWNPRNDADCEAVQRITQSERERQIMVAFGLFLMEKSNTILLSDACNDFIQTDEYLSIPPATDQLDTDPLRKIMEGRLTTLKLFYTTFGKNTKKEQIEIECIERFLNHES